MTGWLVRNLIKFGGREEAILTKAGMRKKIKGGIRRTPPPLLKAKASPGLDPAQGRGFDFPLSSSYNSHIGR
jgi:hypothetical protein